jgi:nicotinamidase-related amidase
MTDHENVQQLLHIKNQAPVTFDASRSALVVVDVQRWFTEPEQAFAQALEKVVPGITAGYFQRIESTVLSNVRRLQLTFRSQDLPVIFLGVGSHRHDGRDLPEWIKDFDQLGLMTLGRRVCPPVTDPAWHIDSRVAPLPHEVVLNKTSSGALSSTRLDQHLHNMGVTSLVVCGLTTAICVAQTAREAADRGFRVVVAEDACTEMSEEMHRSALQSFSWVFGRVQTTEDIMALFTALAATV